MIVSRLISGLGNQMFQYAAAKALSTRLRQPILLDISSYDSDNLRTFQLKDFNISASVTTINQQKRFCSRGSVYYWKNRITGKKICILEDPIWNVHSGFSSITADVVILNGYWAWSDYFKNVREALSVDFSLNRSLESGLDDWKAELQDREAVAVHIRRGDYVGSDNDNRNFGTLALGYYDKAFRFIAEKVKDPVFFMFSDDIYWVEANWMTELSKYGKVVPVRPGTAALDLKKMSACKHQVIANSSFSWWAAWLNSYAGKIVIQPAQWYRNEEWQAVYERTSLNTDTGWIKL